MEESFTLIFRVYKCEFLGLMVRIHESCPKVIAEISVGVFFHIPSSFCEDLSESFLFVFTLTKS